MDPDVSWGDVGQALTYQAAVEALMDLQKLGPDHVKNYRVSCLLMAGHPTERLALVDFFDRLCEGAG